MTGDMDEIAGLEIHWHTSEDMVATPSESVQSVITSPPYWNLKDYEHDDQIGTADESYERYHDRMQTVWAECYDKLRRNGTMWIVADTVMEGGDLQLLPYHIVQRAETVGFRLQDMIVWHKPTAIAGMTDRNVVNKKEHIVYLSKRDEHLFHDETDRENGVEDPAVTDAETLGNLWRYPVKRGTIGQDVLHKAPYPRSLVDRIVRLSTDEGDTVLDPFFGSGTTAYSALKLNRRCIGYELNEGFAEMINDRLDGLRQRSLLEF
jgi:site-specific DNA-methyltransferase (adenine-specific)